MYPLDFFLPYWQLSHHLLGLLFFFILTYRISRVQRFKRLMAQRSGRPATLWVRYGLTVLMLCCIILGLWLTEEVYVKFIEALETGHYRTPLLDDPWWKLAIFSLFVLWIFLGILPTWLRYLYTHTAKALVQPWRYGRFWLYLLFALIGIGQVSECAYAWWLMATA